ncbi:MAG: Ig-like domain-containing protein [Butyrivibrio sp.]|nr:Ig-like domain-containing protein [Butyrivibrio sp.]
MEKRHSAIKIFGMKIILLFMLSVLMTYGINIRAEATEAEQSASGEGGIYNVFPNGNIIKQSSSPEIMNFGGTVSVDKDSLTVTLNNANINGTLQFNGYQNQSDNEMVKAKYTMVLNGESTIYALKLMDAVELTIKGSGTLRVQAPNKNTDYGAALTFNDSYKSMDSIPRLIIEGGTVIVDSTHHGYTLKEAGCIYIKRGAKAVTFIGKTDSSGEIYSVIPSQSELIGNESIPKIFSDLACKATYLSDTNTNTYLSPNGADSSKNFSSTSLFDSEKDKYYQLDFGGVTVTWQSEGTVIEKDVVYPGQTAEYNGDTPTKASDAQYTYTFSGWSPTPGAIFTDTTYTATYTSTGIQINSEGSAVIDDSTETAKDVIMGSITANGSEEMKAAIANANNIEYKVVSAAASNESTGAADILEMIGDKNYTVGAFLDLSLQLFVDGTNVGNVTDLTGNIKIILSIPEALRKDGRIFIIARYHNGKTDIVGTGTGSTATLETDGFSTYAIAYYDEVDKVILLKGETKGSNIIKLTWNKISGATGYTLCGAKCGSNYKEIKTFSSSSKTSYVAKKLKEGKSYKYYVVANGVKDASENNVKSLPVYVMVGDGGKKGNPLKVTAKSKVTVKAGKKAKLGAKVVMQTSKTHIGKGLCDPIRYISSDESIATVTKNGKVKGIKAGRCKVYAVASNGLRKKIKVTVK